MRPDTAGNVLSSPSAIGREAATDERGRASSPRMTVAMLSSVALAIVLAFVAMNQSARILTALAPLYATEINAFDASLAVIDCRYTPAHGRDRAGLMVLATARRMTVIGERVFQPDDGVVLGVHMNAGEILQALVLCMGIGLGWWTGLGHKPWPLAIVTRIAVTALGCLLIIAVDVPPAAYGLIVDGVLRSQPGHATSLLGDWARFLAGGGRLALGLVIGFLVVALSSRVAAKQGASA